MKYASLILQSAIVLAAPAANRTLPHSTQALA